MTELARPTTPDLGPLLAPMRPALWRYLRVLGADAATADDLVQEAFVVALRRPEFDASAPGAVFTFLRTTCPLLANTQIETLRLRSTSGSIDASHPDLVSALANQTSLLVLEVPVIDLGDGRAATTLAQLPKLESLSLTFSSSTAGRLPTPSSLAPLAQSSTLREVELRIYTLAGAPPLAPQPLQQALGAKIQLHVANWGVVPR